MSIYPDKELWLITGSQHLYGKEAINQVNKHAKTIVKFLNDSNTLPLSIHNYGTVNSSTEITKAFKEANNQNNCVGIIVWMHTFSPSKMWIKGLKINKKPLCHLHTQFNATIPWASIDMDFMNLNQSAHGDREFAHMLTRMRINRKTIVGHWKTEKLHQALAEWSRVAMGWQAIQQLAVARIGDNMRQVGVTEGDKVSFEEVFGTSVNAYDTSDITKLIEHLAPDAVSELVESYEKEYQLMDVLKTDGNKRTSLIEAAKIELALRAFLEQGNFKAFTDTFEHLGDFVQLPGIAVQRLMADGYGFGAEGDWKTAALLHAIKVMAKGKTKGTSFMEDYTNHFNGEHSLVLGAHMLEICPSIADAQPTCEVHPLGIGGKADPVRLVFTGKTGPAINVSLVDLGNRFRIIVNEIEAVDIPEKMPNLPVARVLWNTHPNLETAVTAWMLAGGAHHTIYTQDVSTEQIQDFAAIAGVECLVIDEHTTIRNFKNTIRSNETYYHLFQHNM